MKSIGRGLGWLIQLPFRLLGGAIQLANRHKRTVAIVAGLLTFGAIAFNQVKKPKDDETEAREERARRSERDYFPKNDGSET